MLKTILTTTLILSAIPALACEGHKQAAQEQKQNLSLAVLPVEHAHDGQAASVTLISSDANNGHEAMAADFKPITIGDLQITSAAVKAMTPGQPVGGGFVTIVNTGKEDDRLVSATTADGVDHIELHEMAMENDVMKMRQLMDGIPLPAGETVELKPGGLHLMFMGVQAPFTAGKTVKVKLTFEKAGTVEIEMPVKDMKPGMQHKM